MMAAPEIQESIRRTRRALLPSQYPDVGEVVGLSPEEVARLFDLLERRSADLSRSMIQAENHDPTEQRKITAEMRDLLGVRYPRWQQYQKELPVRRQASELTAALSNRGIPLDDATSKALVSGLVAEMNKVNEMSPRVNSATSDRVQSPEGSDLAAQGDRWRVDAASPYLTPAQLEVYRQMVEKQDDIGRLTISLMPKFPAGEH
jgi:hypothetical protein